MFGRHLSDQWKARRPRPAILLGTLLAALTAGPAAHAVTFVTVDGHPNPVDGVPGWSHVGQSRRWRPKMEDPMNKPCRNSRSAPMEITWLRGFTSSSG